MAEQTKPDLGYSQDELRGILSVPHINPTGFSVQGNEWACVVTLSQAVAPNGQTILDVPLAQVAIPWALAKALGMALGSASSELERLIGKEITLPATKGT